MRAEEVPMWSRVASTAVLFALAACTHNILEPGAGNDPGTRTGSISVSGYVYATPTHANVRQPSELTSEFQVIILSGGGFASGKTVTVTSATGTFPLAFVKTNVLGEYWMGSAPSYDEVYVLDVVTNQGTLEGLRVDGPDLHVFSEPEEGATVDAEALLRVVWKRDNKADYAAIDIDSEIYQFLVDTGETSISPRLLAIANPGALQHTLRVERTNRVELDDGAAWSATVVNGIDLITPP
jgi:hypothetical protein